jgi:hypothetical protein
MRVPHIALSHDGRLVAVALSLRTDDSSTRMGVIRLLQWPTLAPVKELRSAGGVTRLAFGNRDDAFASVTADGTIQVWSAEGEELARIPTTLVTTALAFSKDDRRIIALSRGSVTRYLWRLDDLSDAVCQRVDMNLTARQWEQYVPEIYRAEVGSLRCVCAGRPCE